MPWSAARSLLSIAIGLYVVQANVERHCDVLASFDASQPLRAPQAWGVCDYRWLRPSASTRWFGQLLALEQSWDLFAPDPVAEDGALASPFSVYASRGRAW